MGGSFRAGWLGPRESGADSTTVARRVDGNFLPRFLPKQPYLTRPTAPKWLEYTAYVPYHDWLELAHNPKVAGSNPAPAIEEGPGLGLAIVESITEAHDASLTSCDRATGGLRVTVQDP